MEPKQPVSVDGIEFDALIESEENYDGKVPEYPVESGFSVSDTVSLSPLELTLTLYLTPTPITWRNRHAAGEMRVKDVCDALIRKRDAREPFTVVTQNKTYKNMVILQITFKKTVENGYAMEIPVKFRQIYVSETETMAIPESYLRSGKTQAKTGNATTKTVSGKTTADTGKSSSGRTGYTSSNVSSSGDKDKAKASNDYKSSSFLKLGKDYISGIISRVKG